MSSSFGVHQNGTDVFWGEIPPSEHLIQIYEHDQVFLDTLEGFVGGGLRVGDAVIVLGTAPHLEALDERLRAKGIDVDEALASDQYLPMDATEVLGEFMVNGWPDEAAFHRLIFGLLDRAKGPGRKVRAFGELVAIMWARGDQGATVRLEHLWHALCQSEGFSLFCAYPKVGFTADAAASISELCAVHSGIVPCEFKKSA